MSILKRNPLQSQLIGGNRFENTRNVISFLILFALCIVVSFLLATQNMYLVIGLILAIVIFTIVFLSPRIALYFLIFSMLLSPEFGERDLSGEGFTFRFEDFLLIVMGFAWLAKSSIHKHIGLAVHTKLNRPILIYILTCLISTAWGVINGNVRSPVTGFLFVLKYTEYFVVFFLITNNIHSKSQLKNLLWALFITYLIVLLVGFSQIPKGVRISAPFEGQSSEPNTLGGYLLIMFSLNIILFINVKRLLHKAVLGILSVLCFIAILFTLSRATWLGLAVMYLFLMLFAKKRFHLIIALVIGLICAPFFMPDAVIDRIMYTFNLEGKMERETLERIINNYSLNGETFDSSTSARLESMKNAMKDFQKHPLLGYGVTGYMFLDAQFYRVLVETGLLGLLAFLYLLFAIGKSLHEIWKKYGDDLLYNTLIIGTSCAFIGLLVHAIGTNTFIIVRIMEPFWCLIGMCMAIPIIESDREVMPESIGKLS